jgi:hypothetical protein
VDVCGQLWIAVVMPTKCQRVGPWSTATVDCVSVDCREGSLTSEYTGRFRRMAHQSARRKWDRSRKLR